MAEGPEKELIKKYVQPSFEGLGQKIAAGFDNNGHLRYAASPQPQL